MAPRPHGKGRALQACLLAALPVSNTGFFYAPVPMGAACQGACAVEGRPGTSTGSYRVGPSQVTTWAKRRKRDDADFERFDLDELRNEERFEEVEEVDPEIFRPSKMEYYVPAPTDIEHWDVPDTRYVAIGMDVEGDHIFTTRRLPNCHLHLAWARRSYLDPRSPVSVWWDYALVRPDLQGNRGNLFGMNASSGALVKAFIELDPYKKLGIYQSLKGFRWRPVNDTDLLYAPRIQFAMLALDRPGTLSVRRKTRESHLAYLRETQRVVTAGPLFSLDDEDGDPIGSLVIFNADDEDIAGNFVANDPYTRAGLFGGVFVTQVCELDVSGQHLDSQWEAAQAEDGEYYDPVDDLMVGWGLKPAQGS